MAWSPPAAVLAAACLLGLLTPAASRGPGGLEEADEAHILGIGLLQSQARLRPPASSAAISRQLGPLVYFDFAYWDLRPGAGAVGRVNGSCSIRPPNAAFAGGIATGFALGKCPFLVRESQRPVRLGLDLLRDGTTAPGYNPSLIPLPADLKQNVSGGRWLAVLRAGDEQYSMSMCHHPLVRLSDRAAAEVPSKEMLWGTLRREPEFVSAAVQAENRTFEVLPRSFLAVLDEDYEVLTKVAITMKGGDGPYDDAALQDARVVQVKDGRVLVGFQPYYLSMAEPALHANFSYRDYESVAVLHYEALDGGLEAWVDRRETRRITDCPERGFVAPGPKKNLGVFQVGNITYALDWVYPTKVGKLDLGSLAASRSSEQDHFTPLCYGYGPAAPELAASPWAGLWSLPLLQGGSSQAVELHNGSPLVWIQELGEWLGVGHLLRHFEPHDDVSGYNMDFYTQQFYTLAGNPAEGQPFRMQRVTPEFCFESANKPGLCEAVQVATSLVRDRDLLQVGYGVMDCESYIVDIPLSKVLEWLVEVQ